MERIQVHSSNIDGIAYEPASQTLEIAFKRRKDGTLPVYQYANVPRELWGHFLDANSKGEFFSTHFKNRPEFPATRVQ